MDTTWQQESRDLKSKFRLRTLWTLRDVKKLVNAPPRKMTTVSSLFSFTTPGGSTLWVESKDGTRVESVKYIVHPSMASGWVRLYPKRLPPIALAA